MLSKDINVQGNTVSFTMDYHGDVLKDGYFVVQCKTCNYNHKGNPYILNLMLVEHDGAWALAPNTSSLAHGDGSGYDVRPIEAHMIITEILDAVNAMELESHQHGILEEALQKEAKLTHANIKAARARADAITAKLIELHKTKE